MALMTVSSCRKQAAETYRTFATPEDAVRALVAATSAEKSGAIDGVVAIFGPDGKDLIDSSDPASARRARQVFSAAAAEGWHLTDREGGGRTLVIGNESWPFPVPLVREPSGWRFDTAAGREEIITRRIGRNELSVIDTCETYVLAQHLYAREAHDGKPSGAYAAVFRSDTGRENGLYWAAARGGRRSPLGDRVAAAAEAGLRPRETSDGAAPFHGYYFRILTAQGPSAPGGARDYMVSGEMTGGFALIAWPAQYDLTGVMTFIVGTDGVVRQKDLGPGTDAAVRAISRYDPDPSWTPAR